MNEQTGTVTMYDTVEEIKNLNRVEGFDPRKFMRTLTGDDGTTKQYLDVVYRKLWFRLKNPDGKIVKKILKLTDQTAIVEARVYLRKDDAEESYIASALAQKYFERESQFGPKYVELAETAAVGRALADAGYGLQFADLEGEIDPNVVDAPLGIPMGGGSGQNGNPNGGMMAGDTGMQGTYQNQAPPQGQRCRTSIPVSLRRRASSRCRTSNRSRISSQCRISNQCGTSSRCRTDSRPRLRTRERRPGRRPRGRIPVCRPMPQYRQERPRWTASSVCRRRPAWRMVCLLRLAGVCRPRYRLQRTRILRPCRIRQPASRPKTSRFSNRTCRLSRSMPR